MQHQHAAIAYRYHGVRIVPSAWFLERFLGVLGQCVIRKSARAPLATCFYVRDTKNGRWWTRSNNKKIARGPIVSNFDRSLNSLFGLTNTVALRKLYNNIYFIWFMKCIHVRLFHVIDFVHACAAAACARAIIRIMYAWHIFDEFVHTHCKTVHT